MSERTATGTQTNATQGRRSRRCRALLALALALACLLPCPLWAGPDTVLHDYVKAPDPAYSYHLVKTVKRPGYRIHVLSMTSQRWRSHAEVNRVLWSHWLAVIVPDGVRSDIAMLIVEGGVNTRFHPSLHNPVVEAAEHIATTTRTVVVAMGQVPNEPLYFKDEPIGLMEDELVAYSWAKGMDTGDYTWPAYVPMVKSVVRAMDTVQAFMPQVAAPPVRRFVLVGFSKRGAATWLTAAVDGRVLALASGVFDVLDIVAQIEHHYSAYGSYSREMHAYVDYGVVRRLRSPEGEKLLRVVDPYFYLDDVRQPKFLINATGDPFFLPDAALEYVDHLRGETLLRYVPNADHTLRNRENSVMDLVDGLVSWYENLLTGTARPSIAWSVEHGSLRVQGTPAPQSMLLWRAANPKARDFRKKTIGESWVSEPLEVNDRGVAAVPLAAPKRGWGAYFVELHYPGVAGLPQVYTTPVFVLPRTLPYAPIDPIVHPLGLAYWQDQIARAWRHDFSAEIGTTQMAAYFPMPLFDATVRDLDAAEQLMTASDEPASAARRECLATRLNIARRQLGWYSRLDLDGRGYRYLWQDYREAQDAFRRGDAPHARDLCSAMNRADTSGHPRTADGP